MGNPVEFQALPEVSWQRKILFILCQNVAETLDTFIWVC
jgi:hypothetical protein